MYKKFISAFQMLNILMQSLYSLAFPIAIAALISFLLTKYASAPKWIWVILLLLGTFTGLYSMVKYILSATKGLERMKEENAHAEEARKAKEDMHDRLNKEFSNKDDEGEI